MCSVVVAVTGYAGGDPAAPFHKCGFKTSVPSDPICAALPSKAICFEDTAAGCSCALYTGEHAPRHFDIEKERRRCWRRGLSAEKAERKVEALRLELDLNPTKRKRDRYGFVDTIEEIVCGGAQVTPLAHFFHASFDEPFEIKGSTEMPLDHFLEQGGGFPADRLVSLVV